MQQTDETTFTRMGIAALLPGMQHMITLMQAQLDEMRAMLGITQAGHWAAESLAAPVKRGRRPGKAKKGGWPADPLGRAKEQARRKGVALARREAQAAALPEAPKANHPRYSDHPGHAAWLAKIRRKQQKAQAKARTAKAANGAAVIQ